MHVKNQLGRWKPHCISSLSLTPCGIGLKLTQSHTKKFATDTDAYNSTDFSKATSGYKHEHCSATNILNHG